MQREVDLHASGPHDERAGKCPFVRNFTGARLERDHAFARATAIASRWLPVDERAPTSLCAASSGRDAGQRTDHGDSASRDLRAPADRGGDGASGDDRDRPWVTPSTTAQTDTHWTRILHYDVLASESDSATQAADAATQRAPERSPRDFATGHGGEDGASRRRGERVTLFAADGYRIVATRFAAMAPARAHLVVAGGIGVPQRYYSRFAEFAASVGYSTMTLDYRGVGLSAPASLKDFRMEYLDWGRLDLAAAVDAMSGGGVPLFVVGHSFGGHGFGLLPNCDRVSAFYTFGTGAGWHGWMPLAERFKVLFMWNVMGPLLTRWKGYLSWSVLGMGEDLPLDFYRRWKHWCRYPNYFFGDPAMRHLAREFDRVRAPLMAANSIDDRWAPPQSRDAFMAGYRNAARQHLDIDPAQFGLRAIGHMGYFRPEAMPLWKSALAWFDAHRNGESSVAYSDVPCSPRPRGVASTPLASG